MKYSHTEQALNILTKLKASSQNEMEEKGDVNGSESLKMEGGRIESPDCTEVGHLRRQLAQKTQQLVCTVISYIFIDLG